MMFLGRENEIIRIVKKLTGLEFIVVGGYAVSALAKHRFSVDCDIVIQRKELEKIGDVLTKEGYSKKIEKKDFDNEYSGEFIRYTKNVKDLPVSIDLLVDSLVSRITKASWSFDYVKKNSNRANIAGTEDSVECLVPEKELLIAFKIHSGRKTDLRDIIMLRDANWGIVKKHIKRGDLNILKKHVKTMLEWLEDKNLVDSLKGTFWISYDVKKLISSTQNDLNKLLTDL